MLRQVSPSVHMELAAWWGVAEGDRVLVGLVVTVLAALAVAYLMMRLVQSRARRRAAGAGTNRPARRA